MRRSFIAATILLTFLTLPVLAQPTTAPAEKPRRIRLVFPFNGLTTLSDEQKARLADIREKLREKIRALEAEAEAESLAVLTDPQKAELEQVKAAKEAENKAKQAARKQSQSGDDAEKNEGEKKE